MLTDIFRHKNPDLRRYTFSKGQARNYTKARLDYFLINDDALESVTKVGVGRETALSDHCPVYLHLSNEISRQSCKRQGFLETQ